MSLQQVLMELHGHLVKLVFSHHTLIFLEMVYNMVMEYGLWLLTVNMVFLQV